MAKRRVGILGGTFDPPHLGHLILGETIREDFDLDEVLFVPCNEPPHKDRPDLSAATHRYAMVVAATLHNPAFSPSSLEVNRPGKSYSIDTVRALREELGAEAELYFVAGLDAFLEVRTWRGNEELLDACHFIIVSRPSSSFERVLEVLPESFHERVVDVRRGRAADAPTQIVVPEGAAVGSGLRIYLSDAVYLDVSSTEIRSRARTGLSIRYRVTPEVERYVKAHDLYGRKATVAGAAS